MKTLLATLSVILVFGIVLIFGAAIVQTWTADLTREMLPKMLEAVEVIFAVIGLLAFGPNWIKTFSEIRSKRGTEAETASPEQSSTSEDGRVWANVERVGFSRSQ